jgi:hypothetical protein
MRRLCIEFRILIKNSIVSTKTHAPRRAAILDNITASRRRASGFLGRRGIQPISDPTPYDPLAFIHDESNTGQTILMKRLLST